MKGTEEINTPTKRKDGTKKKKQKKKKSKEKIPTILFPWL